MLERLVPWPPNPSGEGVSLPRVLEIADPRQPPFTQDEARPAAPPRAALDLAPPRPDAARAPDPWMAPTAPNTAPVPLVGVEPSPAPWPTPQPRTAAIAAQPPPAPQGAAVRAATPRVRIGTVEIRAAPAAPSAPAAPARRQTPRGFDEYRAVRDYRTWER